MKMEYKQLIWYGHINRINSERWPKRIIKYKPINRRKRGWPCKFWKEGIRDAMFKRHMNAEMSGDWSEGSGQGRGTPSEKNVIWYSSTVVFIV